MITGTYKLAVDPNWRNIQLQEVFLECDTTIAPVTINLFEIAELNRFWGVKIIISDANNNAGTNNITVNANGSDTVDDDTTNQIVINTNGSSVSFQVASETQWLAIESKAGGATPSYKVYTAKIDMATGTVATLLENTLGVALTWTTSLGEISTGAVLGLIGQNNVFVQVNSCTTSGIPKIVSGEFTPSPWVVRIKQTDNAGIAESTQAVYVEIRVYN